jgi:ProP effector
MSTRDKRDVTDLHRQLMDRFPHAFPKDYDALRPLKLGIHVDILQRWPAVDPVLLRQALANHTRRDGYLLALLHHRGDRRYDLDGQPAGTVTEAERAEAARLLEASTQRGQTKAEQVRTHQAREAKRRQQRVEEQRRREEKARRKAEHERREQEIAARKAALIAQGITPEFRSEQKGRLAREAAARSKGQPRAETPAVFERRPPAPPPKPYAGPSARMPDRPEPAPAQPLPPVAFRKKRWFMPPDGNQPG